MTNPSDDGATTDLLALADELLEQAADSNSERAARTLPHPVNGLRQTVIALSDGAQMHEHNSPGPASLLVLRGRARLVAGDDTVDLPTLCCSAIPPRRHSLEAHGDTVVLLTVAVTVTPQPAREP
jgi:quercetin dioxygenase-like cupin family protein